MTFACPPCTSLLRSFDQRTDFCRRIVRGDVPNKDRLLLHTSSENWPSCSVGIMIEAAQERAHGSVDVLAYLGTPGPFNRAQEPLLIDAAT